MHTTHHDTETGHIQASGIANAPEVAVAPRRARWTVAELERIAELADAAQQPAIAEKARRLVAARRLDRPRDDASSHPRFAQVAYVAPVEVLVDLRRGLVERVVVVDELLELDEAEAAREAGSLAPLDDGLAGQAVAIAELDDTQPSARAGWPAWEIGR